MDGGLILSKFVKVHEQDIFRDVEKAFIYLLLINGRFFQITIMLVLEAGTLPVGVLLGGSMRIGTHPMFFPVDQHLLHLILMKSIVMLQRFVEIKASLHVAKFHYVNGNSLSPFAVVI